MYEIIVNLTCINRTSVYFELISWPLEGLIFNDFTVYAEDWLIDWCLRDDLQYFTSNHKNAKMFPNEVDDSKKCNIQNVVNY